MKKHEITPALEALKPVKVNKIGNDKFKKSLLAAYTTLVKEKKKLDEDVATLEKVHLSPFEKEMEEVARLQQEMGTETDRNRQIEIVREINSHKDLIEANKALAKAKNDLGNEEITLQGLDMDTFIDEMDKQGYELGLLEAVFPMFK